MPGVDDYLNQFVTKGDFTAPDPTILQPVPVPVVPSPQDAQQINAAGMSPEAMLMMNEARSRNNGMATDNQIMSDYKVLPYAEFSKKYGQDVTRNVDRIVQGGQENTRLSTDTRSGTLLTGDRTTDALGSVASGFGGSIGDAATFVAGAVNADAGKAMADVTKGFRDIVEANVISDTVQKGRVIAGIRSELDSQDNLKKYEEEKADGEFVASLSYLGRGIVDGASRFIEDPISLETGLAEGVGSLVAGGPIAKGLGAVPRLAGLGKIATEKTFPAAIGMMEGGSAYAGALTEVNNMTHEDLMRTSPTYVDLLRAGDTPEEAQRKVAARAAEIAGAIQAPIGVATGKLVARFEAAPLGSKSFKDMVQNIVRETTEEGVQSATGQASQNIGIQNTADINRQAIEGVGEQAAQGAILGSLTAGVVQAPSVPMVAGRNVFEALKARASEVQMQNEEASGVTEADIRATAQTLATTVEPITQAVEAAVTNVPEDIKSEINPDGFRDRISKAITINMEELVTKAPEIVPILAGLGDNAPKTKLELIGTLNNIANEQRFPIETRQGAALYILDQVEQADHLFNGDLNEVMSSMDQASPEYEGIKNYQSLINEIKNTKSVKDTLDTLRVGITIDIPENTPIQPQVVQNSIQATSALPSALTLGGVRTILKQSDEGGITLTPQERKAFVNTEIALNLAEKADTAISEIRLTDKSSKVADQVMRRGMDNDWGLSIDQHVARINSAIKQNNPELAAASLRNLGNFARSQRNKASAWITSARVGGEQSFTRVGPYGRNLPELGRAVFYADKAGSIATARQITIEANTLIDQFNSLADANPDLMDTRRLERVPLEPKIWGETQTAPVVELEQTTETVVEPKVETPVVDEMPTPAATTVAPKASIKDKFPNLATATKLRDKTVEAYNRFTQSFSTERSGPLLEFENPLRELADNAKSLSSGDVKLSGEQINAFKDYMVLGAELIEGTGGIVDLDLGLYGSLKNRLKYFARQPWSKKDPEGLKTWDKIKAGEDIAGLERGHAFAIVEKLDSGYQYNPALIQTATIAALNWFAGQGNRAGYMDKEDVAKLYGLDVADIDNKTLELFNEGLGLTQAARSLADEITRFWGLATVKDAPSNQARGIPEAIAKELLSSMESMGWLTTDEISVAGSDKVFTQYYFDKTEDNGNLYDTLRAMGPARRLIEEAGLKPEDRSTPVYEKPIETIAATQMRNKIVKNTKTQKQVIRKAQAIPHYFYRNSYEMIRAIGLNSMIELAGSTVIEEKTPFNDEHRKSVKGKNLTIAMAFNALEDQYKDLEAFGLKNGNNDLESIAKYYSFNYTKVDRLQMQGSNNPQSDKINRHVYLPTKTTLDLTDDTSAHSVGFWMAAAQGLGVKTQHYTPEENAAQAKAMTLDGTHPDKNFVSLVQELSQWLKNEDRSSLSDWATRLRQADKGISEHGLMTLLSVAEYINARANNTLSEFVTHNYFEADGVTNGAANALMNLTTEVTPNWIDTVAKAGSFIGFNNKSMKDQKGQPDLYEAGGNMLTVLQKEFSENLTPEVKTVHDALFRIMRGLGMKISVTDKGDIKINRKVLKNPMTITVYGSGVDGIAGNVTSEIIGMLYEAMSEHLQAGKASTFGDDLVVDGKPYTAQNFWGDLRTVLRTKVVNKDNILSAQSTKMGPSYGTNNAALASLKLDANDVRTLRENVRALFVDNMDTAIKSTVMGHVGAMVDNIQKSTNAQSIVMSFMFRKEVLKAMYERQTNPDKYNYRQGDFLSDNELQEIFNRLMPYAAKIETPYQTFLLGAGERSDLMASTKFTDKDGKVINVKMPEAFSRTLFTQLKTAAYAFAPGFAGVAGVPSLNIGTGDGRMIDIFIDNQKEPKFLPVFDGINLPIDKIFDMSKGANAAVAQTWRENPAKYAAESFNKFLALNPLDQMFDKNDPFNVEMDKLALELSKNIDGLRTTDAKPVEDIKILMNDLMNRLDEGQQAIADRITATERLPLSVDQMAGAQTAFTQDGSVRIPEGATSAEIAVIINAEMKRIAAKRNKTNVIAGPNKEFVAAFASKAGIDPDTRAMIADVSVLDAIRKTLNNKLSNNNRELLNAALTSLANSGLTVVYGTHDMVDRFEQNNYPDSYQGNDASFYGKFDVNNNVIYLTNPSVETLVHELIHAATYKKMAAYYANDSDLSQVDNEAIKRLEGLKDEFLARAYEQQGPTLDEATRLVIASMNTQKGNKAAVLNEFVAWSLTNQNLVKLQKNMRVQNPLIKIMRNALSALKDIIWGKKAPAISDDIFTNVKFNARVIMQTPTPASLLMKDFGEVSMYQSTQFGMDERLADLRRRFGEHMFAFSTTAQLTSNVENAAQLVKRRQDALEALINNAQLANKLAIPFHLNMQQISTFKMIGATLATAKHLNSASLARMNEVYLAVIDKILPENFLMNDGRDAEADRYQAQEKFNILTNGGANQLGNFIALATVEPQLRNILRQMELPAKIMPKGWTPDAVVERAAMAFSAGLANYASGQGRQNVDLLSAMEALTQNLIENVGDQRSYVEQRIDNGFDNADNIIKSYIEKGAKRVEAWAETVKSPLGKQAAYYLTLVTKMSTEEGTKSLNRAGVSLFNQPEIKNAQREVFNEIVGRTEENAPVFDMITKSKTFVDQTRQRWRNDHPKELRAEFSRKLSKEELTDLHVGLGKTDAAVLMATYKKAKTLELLGSASVRKAEIKSLESGLSQTIINKAKQLANYMNTGEHGNMLQPNAHAISKINSTENIETQIDNLVTLYAVDSLSEGTLNNLNKLMTDESRGFEWVFASLVSARLDEMAKANGLGRINMLKGHLPGQTQEGVHLFIDDRSNHGKHIGMGYVDLGEYNGSTADGGRAKKSYYMAPVSGRAKYNQGVIQTVQQSVFGVNPETGFSVGMITAGSITDPRAVDAINRRIQNQKATDENLKPIYGTNGRVIGFERMADPKKLLNLDPNYDLTQAIGTWRGRQSEEQSSRGINEHLVDNVHAIWMEGRRQGRMNEYVDMSTSKDPIIADAWSVIPRETKAYIKSVFGEGGFMVQRGMLLDVAGARSASVGDVWTGNSRWSDTTQKQIRDVVIGFMGNRGYKILVNAEEMYQQVITDAKVLIVVKSMVVPAANFVANIYQLSINGVPMRNVFNGFKEKTYELNTYIQNRDRERQLQNELFVAEGNNDTIAMRKLTARIDALQASFKKLSIWPLLEAGEFGSITEGGISQEDLAISKGGYAALIDKLANKLPDGPRDAARYAMVTRDTSLFKALSRATQYGDFLGKAILYDDLTKRKKLNQVEAIAYINEEFVNYNRFAGRNRSYLESMGMIWFYNFKLRSMKVGQRMLHKHPVRALLHTALTPRIPFLGSVGNPITDNMLAVIMDGRVSQGVGPGLLFRAPQLNPWINMTN